MVLNCHQTLGKVQNPKWDTQSLLSLVAFALPSIPASTADTGPLSVSLNAWLLCASGLSLLCSSSLWTLPHPSSLRLTLVDLMTRTLLTTAFWSALLFLPNHPYTEIFILHLFSSLTNMSPWQCLFTVPSTYWTLSVFVGSVRLKKTNSVKYFIHFCIPNGCLEIWGGGEAWSLPP